MRAKRSPLRTSTRSEGTGPPKKVRNIWTTKDCLHYRIVITTGVVASSVTHRCYLSQENAFCRSSNGKCCICCQVCGNNNVGQMKIHLVERMQEYYQKVLQNCNTHMIDRYYYSDEHVGIPDMRVFILEFIRAHADRQSTKQLRDTLEKSY